MKCRKCGKEIDELEIFCDDCKKILKKESSKSELKELEELIEDNERLNELEDTKDLSNLNDLVEEELKEEPLTREEIKKEELPTREEIIKEKEELENSLEKNEPKKLNKKKKIIIIVSIILFLLIIVGIVLFFIFKPSKKEEKVEKIDYELVINEYGKEVERIAKKYIEENGSIPTWQNITELNKYKKYEVVCSIHNIYEDGNIYLDDCKVNDKNVKYSYGQIQEEKKEGRKLNVYKVTSSDYNYYIDEKEKGSKLVGTITCLTDDCEYVDAYDKYVLVTENRQYYLYNYETDTMEFGPFNTSKYTYYNNMLTSNNKLYGIYYEEDNVYNIYNVTTGKTIKNVKGELLESNMVFDPTILYKYNLVVLENNNGNIFINLNTGNIVFTIKENLGRLYEDENNKIVYITAYNNDYNKFKIYNSNGKSLFNGEYFSGITLTDNGIIVSKDKTYTVYDSKLKVKTNSKTYDKVLGVYSDFIVVLDNNHLEIVDLNDKVLATFDFEWDDSIYVFHSTISGWYTDNGKYGIYLVVENTKVPYGTKGSGLEYYYIPNTKETGVIETEGVGGYAKPVLYLYPEEKTDVTVTFKNTKALTTTYPKFKDSWNVTAYPNGDLYDSNGNYYYALYWEEDSNHYVDFGEGFYVDSKNAIKFLEEKLSIIGLNSKERNEFIMYWLPILEKNKHNLVYFELTKERDAFNKLIIDPKPDSILRVAMHVKKVNKKTSIKEQHLTSFDRNGFSAIEWGGVIY